MKLLDVVALAEDLPRKGLRKGQVGTHGSEVVVQPVELVRGGIGGGRVEHVERVVGGVHQRPLQFHAGIDRARGKADRGRVRQRHPLEQLAGGCLLHLAVH